MSDNEILLRLILGNRGDETALRNICESHDICMEELTPEETEYMYHTNNFYYSVEEFCTIHREGTTEMFNELLGSGIIAATTDGFVWKNCV